MSWTWMDGEVTRTFSKAQNHQEVCHAHKVGIEAIFWGWCQVRAELRDLK